MARTLLAALLLAVLVAVPVASGQSESDLDGLRDEIAALEGQIDAAEAARTDAAAEVSAAATHLDDLIGQVNAAQGILDGIRSEIATEETELARVERLLDHFQGVIASTRSQMDSTETELQGQVAELYMNAATAGVRLLSFKSAQEASIGFAYVDGGLGASTQLIRQLEILRTEEERQQALLDEQRGLQTEILASLDEKRGVQEVEVARVDGLRAEAVAAAEQARALVAAINTDIANFEEHKEGLEADAAQLEAELAARGSEGEQPTSGLMRPVPGAVTSGYGYRIHPIFGTRKLHTGWDMNASSGEPIVAAASGAVVSAGVRGGYGNAVVIDHGGGLATLYAHQSSMAVSAGQSVDQGQVIGYVGCTGYCTGAHLHFETRVNGAPVDPSGYVR